MKPDPKPGPAKPLATILPFRQPIRTYFDPSVNFMVKVYAPGHASGDLSPENRHGD